MDNVAEILQKIAELRGIRKYAQIQEQTLTDTLVCAEFRVEDICRLFFEIKGIMRFENYRMKELFVFVCIQILHPTYMLGDRLEYGNCRRIAACAGMTTSKVSAAAARAKVLYRTYKDFQYDTDFLSDQIRRRMLLNYQYRLF
jgi:hypothetical protein